VLQRPDGSFLLAQRPEGKIWAGHWEFPGGKVEAGESTRDALVRELREELGIEVITAYPWITRVFTYPHATVRLSFFRVTAWQGELYPHEGQQFSWQNLPQPLFGKNLPQPLFGKNLPQPLFGKEGGGSMCSVSPILPANGPVIDALALPPLYAISNVAELGVEEFMLRLDVALKSGLRLLQLREKNLTEGALRLLAHRVVALAHQYGAGVLLSGDEAMAREVGADGVHLTSTQLAECAERPAMAWCAASCHSSEELRRAEALGCDFALLSPVLPTLSHPGAPHLGWEQFSEMAQGLSIPVYALGGLTHADMQTAWQHGAHGIALLRQAW
jgi:8-oxo-dGTP diphosphatase